jgi:ankyrin repeat protein
MRAPGNMLTRPEPKLRDKIDALGLVKVLLAHKANPNARLKKPIIGRHQNLVGDASLAEGATALARASKACDLPVIRLLLDGGADATLTLKDRTTTAMLAANGTPEPKALEAVQLLVDRGVDVNAFNANGQTILHNAAGRGANSIVQFVADRGAKLDRRDKQNRTALDLALGLGGGGGRRGAAARGRGAEPNEQTASLLRELMAKKGLSVTAPSSDTK